MNNFHLILYLKFECTQNQKNAFFNTNFMNSVLTKGDITLPRDTWSPGLLDVGIKDQHSALIGFFWGFYPNIQIVNIFFVFYSKRLTETRHS